MKIKTKLIISFCIIIFVPSILAIATIGAYCNFQSHVIEQTYGIKNADAYSIINSVPMLNRYTALDFEKIKNLCLTRCKIHLSENTEIVANTITFDNFQPHFLCYIRNRNWHRSL